MRICNDCGQPVKLDLPESLTCDEFDEYVDSEVYIDDGKGDPYEAAKQAALEKKGILYTQVDSGGESNEPLYSRGWHLINRTGVYGVIWSTRKYQYYKHCK